MTDMEINKALALAIGWEHVGLSALKEDAVCVRDVDGWWHTFDYLDWNVIGPIAEQYNCFPSRCWPAQLWRTPRIINGKEIERIAGVTPQQAIALAVIASKK